MDLTALYVVLGALLRSILGWLSNSLKDGKIDMFEWKLCIETVIRVGFIGILIAYCPGASEYLNFFDATVIALIADKVLSAIKKKG